MASMAGLCPPGPGPIRVAPPGRKVTPGRRPADVAISEKAAPRLEAPPKPSETVPLLPVRLQNSLTEKATASTGHGHLDQGVHGAGEKILVVRHEVILLRHDSLRA